MSGNLSKLRDHETLYFPHRGFFALAHGSVARRASPPAAGAVAEPYLPGEIASDITADTGTVKTVPSVLTLPIISREGQRNRAAVGKLTPSSFCRSAHGRTVPLTIPPHRASAISIASSGVALDL